MPKKAIKKTTRPKLWSEDYVKRVFPKAIMHGRGIMNNIAEQLGTTTPTLYQYIKKYPWINDLRQQARERFVDVAENQLAEKVEAGEDWAVKFTLTTLGRNRGYDTGNNLIIHNNTLNMNVELPEEKKREMLDFIEQIDNRKKEND